MDGNLLPDGNVSIPFEKTNGVYTLKDALVLSPDAAASLTQEEFDSVTQRRFDNWIAQLEAEPFPIPEKDSSDLLLNESDWIPEPDPLNASGE